MKKTFIYTLLVICGLTMIVPFVWMLGVSLRSQLEVNQGASGFNPVVKYQSYTHEGKEYQVSIVIGDKDSTVVNLMNDKAKIVKSYLKVPTTEIKEVKRLKFHWSNYTEAFRKVPFNIYFFNTIFVAIMVLIGTLITSALAAYAFARMHFYGKDFIFYFLISMMMVPEPIFIIPSYILLNKFGWINTYNALIIPWIANIFTIFLMRQHFKTIPQDLLDAAAIDGCSPFKILYRIILPLSKSIIATASVFSIIGSWNSFMWPLVMTNSPELRVLQVGLSYFSQEASSQTTLLMAASSFSILPLIVIFLFAQKSIIESYSSSGMKE
ncbi:MAG TPA: carbohydrate ABC transporter permease [Candidatus Cloacimonadota bacterium]|jgi:ABC-type glycerol-3-phosphate transport system permease component|nr:carbohydrate ABC transporter permease [Candidatus Cloacimonadales bacterium]HPY95904.1 carbohydrate ABC transporter permease [Candidatus Cloacimonadota bacterium]HQB40915.1 carbohydrate ABC transporter permease [Candidatus Cloacimonadota bacterium]